MNVLITGGAGYIGSELVNELSKKEEVNKIIIYDNLSRKNYNLFFGNKLNSTEINFIKGDLLDKRKLKLILSEIDIIIHLAAKVSTPFADSNPHEFDQTNNWGTSELISTIEDGNYNIKKFIHLSSTSVYGASNDKLDINSPTIPKTFYGISKLKGEQQVERLFDSSIQTIILRSGNVYGYGQSMRMDSVVNKFSFEANFNNKIVVHGDGEQKRCFIQINRLTKIIANILDDSTLLGTYNLVENNYSINDIVYQLSIIYPSLELTNSTSDMPMRNLLVKPDKRLEFLGDKSNSNLYNDIKKLSENFSF
jgi:UDP-glucose 4-epimerase